MTVQGQTQVPDDRLDAVRWGFDVFFDVIGGT